MSRLMPLISFRCGQGPGCTLNKRCVAIFRTNPRECMREECLDRSLGCDDTLTTYRRVPWLVTAPIAASKKLHQFRRLQGVHCGLVSFTSWGSLHPRRPLERPSTRERREDQRCKEFLMLNAMRVWQVVHKGALPITNPAHSQQPFHFGEPS